MEREVYPGGQVGVTSAIALAREYHKAAQLLASGRRGRSLSRAPARLCAIHAVELNLNAFLLAAGFQPAAIRGLQHDLATRGDMAVGAGLRLRWRTHAHLRALSERREYLMTRYDPDLSATLTPDSGMMATLVEIASKVAPAIAPAVAATELRCTIAVES